MRGAMDALSKVTDATRSVEGKVNLTATEIQVFDWTSRISTPEMGGR